MRERFEVVIVGAGVIGCSIAFHLGRAGQKRVAILEREAMVGTGSTARANGGIRAQFTTTVNIAMSLRSMALLDALEDEIGQPPLYRKAGYLFVTASAERFAAMEAAADFQRRGGVSVDVLGPKQLVALAPYISSKGLVGGTFGPRDGFIDPGGLTNFWLAGARRAGVEVRTAAEVVTMRPASGVFVVETRGRTFESPVVVDAAGPWAAGVAAMLGVELPVRPVRRQIFVSGPCPAMPRLIPMTIDADTAVLIRREGDRVAIAYSNPDEPPGFNTTLSPDLLERIAEPIERRFPLVAAAGVDLSRSWAGLYEETPDHHAVLGEVPGIPGFIIAAGFSGHGVMHSPAAGESIAELIVTGRCAHVDVAPLGIERFAHGKLIRETMVL
jgi:sarcosine oxidase subunit beta